MPRYNLFGVRVRMELSKGHQIMMSVGLPFLLFLNFSRPLPRGCPAPLPLVCLHNEHEFPGGTFGSRKWRVLRGLVCHLLLKSCFVGSTPFCVF